MGWSFSKPSPRPDPTTDLMKTGWCEIDWSQNQDNLMKEKLKKLKPAVGHLHVLVVGPVGAGKSSFINSMESIFQNRMINAACIVAASSGKSFTTDYTTYQFKDEGGGNLPFVISDAMGLENGKDYGVQPEDIINALKGHIKEGYTFNPRIPCLGKDTDLNMGYNHNPTLKDKVHCLVFVIPAWNCHTFRDQETSIQMNDTVIQKMENIRQKACDLRIPHMVILTKVDEACPHVKEDIKHIYRSKVIYRMAQRCSNALGVPMSCIFPVKNYHEELQLNPDVDAVLLFTLTKILDYAYDFVVKMAEREAARNRSMVPLV